MRLFSLFTLATSAWASSALLVASTFASMQIPVGTASFTLHQKGYIQPTYNEKGNIDKITYFDASANAYSNQVWSYNASGRVEKKQYKEDLVKFFNSSSFQYSYTPQGHFFEEKEFNRFNCLRTVQYNYTPSGQIEGIVSFGGSTLSQAPQESLVLSYTSSGLLERATLYDKEGAVCLHYEWKYDALDRESARCVYNGDLKLIGYTYTEYDFDKDQDLEIAFDGHEQVISNTLILKDENGRVRERGIYNPEGVWVGATLYTYAQTGELELIQDLAQGPDSQPVVVGYLASNYNEQRQVELYSYHYMEFDLLLQRLVPYLQLPGNALITPPWQLTY